MRASDKVLFFPITRSLLLASAVRFFDFQFRRFWQSWQFFLIRAHLRKSAVTGFGRQADLDCVFCHAGSTALGGTVSCVCPESANTSLSTLSITLTDWRTDSVASGCAT